MVLHPELFVLIESDWNLKSFVTFTPEYRSVVLIESDWNLKVTMRRSVLPGTLY